MNKDDMDLQLELVKIEEKPKANPVLYDYDALMKKCDEVLVRIKDRKARKEIQK